MFRVLHSFAVGSTLYHPTRNSPPFCALQHNVFSMAMTMTTTTALRFQPHGLIICLFVNEPQRSTRPAQIANASIKSLRFTLSCFICTSSVFCMPETQTEFLFCIQGNFFFFRKGKSPSHKICCDCLCVSEHVSL